MAPKWLNGTPPCLGMLASTPKLLLSTSQSANPTVLSHHTTKSATMALFPMWLIILLLSSLCSTTPLKLVIGSFLTLILTAVNLTQLILLGLSSQFPTTSTTHLSSSRSQSLWIRNTTDVLLNVRLWPHQASHHSSMPFKRQLQGTLSPLSTRNSSPSSTQISIL